MNTTSPKPMEEILGSLQDAKNVFVLVCGGCPVGVGTASPQQVDKVTAGLEEGGKTVVGSLQIDFLCNKALVGAKLQRQVDLLKKADAILVLSCGVGVQSTATMIDIRCVPGLNTISLGGTQGIWPSNERCGLCGDCLLALTGGICPITMCSKSLVNGTCGGTNDGKCEVSSKKDCGWYLIYKRLEELGRTEDLLKLAQPRDHALQLFPDKLKNSIRWALEVDNAEPAKESSGGKK